MLAFILNKLDDLVQKKKFKNIKKKFTKKTEFVYRCWRP